MKEKEVKPKENSMENKETRKHTPELLAAAEDLLMMLPQESDDAIGHGTYPDDRASASMLTDALTALRIAIVKAGENKMKTENKTETLWRLVDITRQPGNIWQCGPEQPEEWDADELLNELSRSEEVVELIDGAKLPEGIEDIRARVVRVRVMEMPDRIFAQRNLQDGQCRYFGLTKIEQTRKDEK